ncbi:MAG: polysaccharide deacetylase family protein [Acidobacteria bacterium]|nr:polysaccharide deacetylase family protein [Acidobacteriota bacterium]MCA1610983.1 polysaccharide deacetylase family protein [Acidobacteriota bacterium]
MNAGWRVPVLTYHAVGEGPRPLFTPSRLFDAHLAALEKAGLRTVPLSALVDALAGGKAAPERSVAVTFDDGYRSFVDEAWPRLQAHGFGATVFLVSGHCGGDNLWQTQKSGVPRSALLDWDQAGRLAAEGVELGAHSRTHAPLTVLSEAEAETEIAGSRADIEARTGHPVRLFAYPYGASNPGTEAIVRRHFAGAVSVRLGIAGPSSDPFQIPRVDAHYVSAASIAWLRRDVFRAYLSARQVLRDARRRVSSDWSSPGDPTRASDE